MTVIDPSVNDDEIDPSMLLRILSLEQNSVHARSGGQTVGARFQLTRPPTITEVEQFQGGSFGVDLEAGIDVVSVEWDVNKDAGASVREWNVWLNDARLSSINRLNREAKAERAAEDAFSAVHFDTH